MNATVAVLGATGLVGTTAVRMLAERGVGRLRLGARDGRRLGELSAPSNAERRTVDLNDPPSLEAFCRGARIVLNCAGPSYLVLDRVARAALASGCDYVDVSGDSPAHRLLEGSPLLAGQGKAVLSAGMLPALANAAPRLLADDLTGARLTVYAGGIERFSPAAAGDLVLSVDSSGETAGLDGDWYGETLASWRNGRRRRKSLSPRENVEIAGFPGLVTVMPFLSADAERLARSTGLAELQWFNVFVGEQLRLALGRLRGRVERNPGAFAKAVSSVVDAAELDLAGIAPFYSMAFSATLRDEVRTALLRTHSSFDLTAAVAVATVSAMLDGSVPPGLHFADEILDPHALLETVTGLGALSVWEIHSHAHDDPFEMGEL